MEYMKANGCYRLLSPAEEPEFSSLTTDVAIADITKTSAESFAKQITLIELSLFKAIRREEFASLKWNGKEKHVYAPNIVASTRWFNQINFWVQKEILKYSCVSKRTELLAFFIKIAKKLVDCNNLYSAMSIVSALQIECIYRLRHTWAGLGNKDRTAYRRLEELFSQDDNCRRQREHMNSISLPGIPYLGLYLSDLTYTNVAHPRVGGKPTAIWTTKINGIIDTIAYFQQSEYSFPVDGAINAYLCAQRYIEELQKFLEEDNYKTSLNLEPPEIPPEPTLSVTFNAVEADRKFSSFLNRSLDSASILGLKSQKQSVGAVPFPKTSPSVPPAKLASVNSSFEGDCLPPLKSTQLSSLSGTDANTLVNHSQSDVAEKCRETPILRRKSATIDTKPLIREKLACDDLDGGPCLPKVIDASYLSSSQPNKAYTEESPNKTQTPQSQTTFCRVERIPRGVRQYYCPQSINSASNSAKELPPLPPRPPTEFTQGTFSQPDRLSTLDEKPIPDQIDQRRTGDKLPVDACPSSPFSATRLPVNKENELNSTVCVSPPKVCPVCDDTAVERCSLSEGTTPVKKSLPHAVQSSPALSENLLNAYESDAATVAACAAAAARQTEHIANLHSSSAQTTNTVLDDQRLALTVPSPHPSFHHRRTSSAVDPLTAYVPPEPLEFGVHIVRQGVIQRRTMVQVRASTTSSLTSPRLPKDSNDNPAVYDSNDSLATISTIGPSGSKTNEKPTFIRTRPAGFGTWKRFWMTLVLVGEGSTGFMIYFEPKFRNAAVRNDFQAHHCQIQSLVDFRPVGTGVPQPEHYQRPVHEGSLDVQTEVPKIDEAIGLPSSEPLIDPVSSTPNPKVRPFTSFSSNFPSHYSHTSSHVDIGRHKDGSSDSSSFVLTHPTRKKVYRIRPLTFSHDAPVSSNRIAHSHGPLNWFRRSGFHSPRVIPRYSQPGLKNPSTNRPTVAPYSFNSLGRARGASVPGIFTSPRFSPPTSRAGTLNSKLSQDLMASSVNSEVSDWIAAIQYVLDRIELYHRNQTLTCPPFQCHFERSDC
ncbi:unnamed protein product [Calicophoron daubneyi]|uniref:Ras-GEF domain-containing protein n=1 Tax=Calicophoron daubneyi TaxID=300641 RepID=A0AAV2TWX9_CALDB